MACGRDCVWHLAPGLCCIHTPLIIWHLAAQTGGPFSKVTWPVAAGKGECSHGHVPDGVIATREGVPASRERPQGAHQTPAKKFWRVVPGALVPQKARLEDGGSFRSPVPRFTCLAMDRRAVPTVRTTSPGRPRHETTPRPRRPQLNLEQKEKQLPQLCPALNPARRLSEFEPSTLLASPCFSFPRFPWVGFPRIFAEMRGGEGSPPLGLPLGGRVSLSASSPPKSVSPPASAPFAKQVRVKKSQASP